MEEQPKRRIPGKEERRLQSETSTRVAMAEEQKRLDEARAKSARLKALREA